MGQHSPTGVGQDAGDRSKVPLRDHQDGKDRAEDKKNDAGDDQSGRELVTTVADLRMGLLLYRRMRPAY